MSEAVDDAGTVPTTTVAAFDFDGTLTNRDSVVPFLRRFVARPIVVGRAIIQLPQVVGAGVARDRDRLRIAATRAALAGVPFEQVQRAGAAFAAEVLSSRLRADTPARLAWHRAQGHRVVLVSASYEVYLHDVAAALDIEAVIATQLEVDGSDRCTGRLDGDNCRGAEKVRRLERWFDSVGLERSLVRLWAYGDSAGDTEMLAYADHPVWAKDPLASVAAIP